MGRRSWIHLIRCRNDHNKIIEYSNKNDIIFVVGAALIEGKINCVEYIDRESFGEEKKNSLVLLTQSDGSSVINEMIEKGVIDDWSLVLSLSNVNDLELEHTKHGAKIKNAKYLSNDDYEIHLDLLDKDDTYNNLKFYNEKELKATGILFMQYISKIISGIYTYLNDNYNPKVDSLFSDATNLFNTLGSWVYGGRDGRIVYHALDLFLRKANFVKTESFSYLSDYIKYICEDLMNILKENHLVELNFYDTLSIRGEEDEQVGLLLIWRLGTQMINIIETSQNKNVPILLQPFQVFSKLFDALGKWIFSDYEISEISYVLEEFGKALGYKQNEVFHDIIDELKDLYHNVSQFLKERPKSQENQILYKKIKLFKGAGDFYPYGFHPHIIFSSNSTSLYTTAENNSIIELDINTGQTKIILKYSDKPNDDIVSFIISNDNQFILTCAFEEPLKLWDRNSGKLLREFYHEDILTEILISSDNKYILASGEGEIIYIWNLFTGQLKLELDSVGSGSIALSPDNQYIIGANKDSEIIASRIEDGKVIKKFIDQPVKIVFIGFTPDCTKVISVNEYNIKIWEYSTGNILREFQIYEIPKNDDHVNTAILSPDGRYLCAPTDTCLKIWNITTGELIQELPFIDTYIMGNAFFSLAFSQDGTYLGMSDGSTIYIWEKIHSN